MNLKYCGPARDYSGYGEAVRHDIAALQAAGVTLTTQIPHYCLEISDFGDLGALAGNLESKVIDYRVKIIHTTPNVYSQFFEPGKYHIGRVFWETDKLPLDFAQNVNHLDEVWTGSSANEAAIRKAGVGVPIYIIPEAIDTNIPDLKSYRGIEDTEYKFYSVFEWTERKNWKALLESYWREFEHTKGVSLTLKTYVDNFTPDKKQEIYQEARAFRNSLGLTHYAPLYFFTNLMDRNQIYRFHATFDCFVSAHRGEGWGIPQMEAMLLGKPTISTNYGGIHEYLHDKEDALLLPYTLIPLRQNTRNTQWYASDQNWADVDKGSLREAFRWVFEHRDEAKKIGEKGSLLVKKLFSLETVGNMMVSRLKTIGI